MVSPTPPSGYDPRPEHMQPSPPPSAPSPPSTPAKAIYADVAALREMAHLCASNAPPAGKVSSANLNPPSYASIMGERKRQGWVSRAQVEATTTGTTQVASRALPPPYRKPPPATPAPPSSAQPQPMGEPGQRPPPAIPIGHRPLTKQPTKYTLTGIKPLSREQQRAFRRRLGIAEPPPQIPLGIVRGARTSGTVSSEAVKRLKTQEQREQYLEHMKSHYEGAIRIDEQKIARLTKQKSETKNPFTIRTLNKQIQKTTEKLNSKKNNLKKLEPELIQILDELQKLKRLEPEKLKLLLELQLKLQNQQRILNSEVVTTHHPKAGASTPPIGMGHPLHKEAWKDFDSFTESIVAQFPTLPIDTSSTARLGDPPLVDNFNNYGLEPDPGSVVKIKDGTVESFWLNGKQIQPGVPVIEIGGLLFCKIQKGEQQYHDQALSSSSKKGPQVITLCDGTGQLPSAKDVAQKACEMAQKTTEEGLRWCITLQDALKLQFSAIKAAQEALLKDQKNVDFDKKETIADGTTLVQASITGDILSGVAVGDSKVFIFSPKDGGGWTCRDAVGETRASLDPRDSGGRIGRGDEFTPAQIELANMKAFAVKLKLGDVVYVCSDGGHDPFDPSILQNTTPAILGGTEEEWQQTNPEHMKLAQEKKLRDFEETVANCRTAKEMHEAIKKESQKRTANKKVYMMTGDKRERLHQPGEGKADDMAMVFFQYNPPAKSAK